VKTCACTSNEMRAGDSACRPASRWRRGGEVAGWIVPGALLVLMPKCPMCVAGYVAAVSGLGVSLTSAAYLRTGLVGLCVGALVFLGARFATRMHRARNGIQ
jgi:hypothetical protein